VVLAICSVAARPEVVSQPAREALRLPFTRSVDGTAVDLEERANLERVRASHSRRADHTGVEVDRCRSRRQDLLGAADQHPEPAGAVVHPLREGRMTGERELSTRVKIRNR